MGASPKPDPGGPIGPQKSTVNPGGPLGRRVRAESPPNGRTGPVALCTIMGGWDGESQAGTWTGVVLAMFDKWGASQGGLKPAQYGPSGSPRASPRGYLWRSPFQGPPDGGLPPVLSYGY